MIFHSYRHSFVLHFLENRGRHIELDIRYVQEFVRRVNIRTMQVQ